MKFLAEEEYLEEIHIEKIRENVKGKEKKFRKSNIAKK